MKKQLPLFLNAVFLLLGVFAGYSQNPGPGHCIGFGGAQSLSGLSLPAYNVDNALTIEAWILPYSLSGNQTIAGNYTLPAQGFSFELDATGNLGLRTSQGVLSGTGGLISNSAWVHVAVAVSGTTVSFFVNGEAAGTQTLPGTSTSTAQTFFLSRQGNPNAPQFFNGELDEVRLWDQALTQTQIRDWMCRKANSSHPAYANLKGYWRLDNGNGLTASDLSTSANHLSLDNNPMWGWSGAPIGDISVHLTSADLPNGALQFAGDTLWIDQLTGSPARLHAYIVQEAPNNTTSPAGYSSIDITHYYGLYFVGGTNPTINGRFAFGGSSFASGTHACNIMTAVRPSANFLSWDAGTGIPDQAGRRLTLQSYPRLELIPGIRPHPHPITSYPGDTTCAGTTITLQAPNGASSYQWHSASGSIPGAITNQFSVQADGDYHLMTTLNGCSYSSDTVHLHFRSLPQVAWGMQDTLCSDEPNLILSGATPAGGLFSGPGVSGNQFDATSAGAGSHTLTYSFTDSLGCTNSATAQVLVALAPIAAIGTFGPACQLGGPVTLSGGIPAGGNFEGFGVSGNIFSPNITGPGTWQVDYVVTTPLGCDDTASILIEVLPAPITPSVSVAGATLFSSSPAGNQWYDLSGPVPGATGQIFSPLVDGTYYVVVTDQNGCSSDTSNHVFVLANSISTSTEAEAAVWPQPARETLYLKWTQAQAGQVALNLFNSSGKLLQSFSMHSNWGENVVPLQVSDLSPGLYMLQVGQFGQVKFWIAE